ncbi:MAG: FKBP-type peptidyl-prolyl cis-trans isomerase [Muribaculaceae bacterium]|nr:FKBP-type peptidyl-prolyl cis-trans isomerase [Muribaculaceae bacterium]
MKFTRIFPFLIIGVFLILSSCFKDSEETDYTEWRNLNAQAFNDSLALIEDGKLVYSEIIPDWDKSFSILMRWHNDRSENTNLLYPLSTSTCIVNYKLTNVQGEKIDSMADFNCVPNKMITGFMAAVTNMNVGDTVTTVIPYTAGYGAFGSGNVPPFTTLVFGIRLKSIQKLM